MKITKNNWINFVLFLIMPFLLTACPKKQVVKKVKEKPPLSVEKTEKMEDVDVEELSIHEKEFSSVKGLEMVKFDFDSSNLSEEARTILASNASILKKNSRKEILVEGHCDERGTIAYNLTLGQKRASSVRRYYISLGIPGERIGAISYGEEKPICKESREECWLENRRAETKVRSEKSRRN